MPAMNLLRGLNSAGVGLLFTIDLEPTTSKALDLSSNTQSRSEQFSDASFSLSRRTNFMGIEANLGSLF